MKVLWICNQMPPVLARAVGRKGGNKEGWITGMAIKLSEDRRIEMGMAFPLKEPEMEQGVTENIAYYSFYEDTDHPENYDNGLEASLGLICEEFNPDVIHIFGTEFPHCLAMLRLKEWRSRVLIHLQGLMQPCSEVYYAGIPEEVRQRSTFRDVLRRDSILQQKEKYELRARHEQEALKLCHHVCGRTAFDRDYVLSLNPNCQYYAVNETLRPTFYGPKWNREEANEHQIFASQGNFPLKGLHYILQALAIVKKQYPDVTLHVAGDKITAYETWKDKLKLSSYGKYLRDLVSQGHLERNVEFLGNVTADEMLEEYLSSEIFIISSVVENSPNSLGEAMLLGMPCIASRVGGIVSLAEEDVDVLMYEPEHVELLAQEIMELFEDPDREIALGRSARAHAKLTHDAQANYRMLVWVYEQVAGGK